PYPTLFRADFSEGAGAATAAAAGGAAGAAALSTFEESSLPVPGAAAGGAPAPARNPSMSAFVTRPEMPVPGICEMSTPFSSAIARTTGDERRLRSSSCDSPGPGGAEEEEGVED